MWGKDIVAFFSFLYRILATQTIFVSGTNSFSLFIVLLAVRKIRNILRLILLKLVDWLLACFPEEVNISLCHVCGGFMGSTFVYHPICLRLILSESLAIRECRFSLRDILLKQPPIIQRAGLVFTHVGWVVA